MKTKINCACNAQNVSVATALGVDFVGLSLGKQAQNGVVMQPQCVGCMPDLVAESAALPASDGVCGSPSLVGMFVDDTAQTVITAVYNFKLDFVQFDGNEGAIFIDNLKRTIVPDIRKSLGVIKTITVASVGDFDACREYEGVADMFLFRIANGAGSTASADECRRLLGGYGGSTPFLLAASGGNTDMHGISEACGDSFCGVDAEWSFANADGNLDACRLREFVNSKE